VFGRQWWVALIAAGVAAAPVPAQELELELDLDLEEMAQSVEAWAVENLDEEALRALREADREQVLRFFTDIQKQLHGDYVLDLGGLKDTARAALPLLQQYEETAPYAAWLKPRLDYFEVVDQLILKVPPPKPEPGQPPPPRTNPPPALQREIWVRKLAGEPWPPAARTLVPQLKPIFKQAGVPPELVWIAEVESSFDPRARSPAGAAGLFQLMPATARQHGLRTTWPLDQRLKPEPSARAAAQHLAYLYRQFKDWRLALAAYNAGEGTVRNALKRQAAASFDAIASRLPAETQMYVPKVEAVLLRREGLSLNRLHPASAPAGKS